MRLCVCVCLIPDLKRKKLPETFVPICAFVNSIPFTAIGFIIFPLWGGGDLDVGLLELRMKLEPFWTFPKLKR